MSDSPEHAMRRTPLYAEHIRAGGQMVPFAEGFPDAMDDEMVVTDYRYNLYMVVEE